MTYSAFEHFILELNEEIMFRREVFLAGLESRYNKPDCYYEMVNFIINKRFGKKGVDWIYWYLYVKLPNPTFVRAYDESGSPICYDIPSLYDYLCSV